MQIRHDKQTLAIRCDLVKVEIESREGELILAWESLVLIWDPVWTQWR